MAASHFAEDTPAARAAAKIEDACFRCETWALKMCSPGQRILFRKMLARAKWFRREYLTPTKVRIV